MIIGSNFKLSSRKFLDDRQQIQSLELLNANENNYLYPLGFEVFCIEEGKWYQNVSTDKNVPLWKERKGSGSLNIDDVIADGEILNNKTWSSEYIDSFKTNIETLIVDNEDYIAEIEDRLIFIEGELHWLETFDGSYDSLTNKPFIPSSVSQLENDKEYITEEELTNRLEGIEGNIDSLHTHENKDILDSITEEKIEQWDSIFEDNFNGDYDYLQNKPILKLGDDSEIVVSLRNAKGVYIVNGTIGEYPLTNELAIISGTDEYKTVTLPNMFKVMYFEIIGGVMTKIGENNYQVDKDNANISNSLNIGTDNIVGENNQIVQGKYNVEDTEGKYINIVGNGEDEENRRNVHTLDWEGNAWYNGKVSQEGIPTEDKDLVTKGYVDGKFATSERVEKYIEDNDKENARRDVIIDALANGRRRTIDYVDGEADLFYATEKDDIFIDKIEGETLVNVCDQEEPIAITKSYTVENTNHVALQGEYDGKCRPVVYGNTLVNRNVEHDKSIVIGNTINESGTEVNIIGTANSEVEVSLDGHTALNLGTKKGGELCKSFESASGNEIKLTTDRNSKTDVVCQGDTLVNVANGEWKTAGGSHRTEVMLENGFETTVMAAGSIVLTKDSMFKDNTTYTFIFDINTNLSTINYSFYNKSSLGVENWIHEDIYIADNGDYSNGYTRVIKVMTTGKDCSSFVIGVHGSGEGVEVGDFLRIKNLMIFEGDLTQTPELIPTEYVESIQSTFEDKYIPYSIYNGDNLTSVTETQYQLLLTVKTNTEYTVVTTINTTKYQYAIYSQDSLSKYLAYENTLSTAIFSSDKANILFKVRMNPSYEGEDYNFVLDEVKDKFLIVEGNFSGRENLLTSEYFGKYKVDMSSVGKNLIDINSLVKKYPQVYQLSNNILTFKQDGLGQTNGANLSQIPYKKNTQYTLSYTTATSGDNKNIGFTVKYEDGSTSRLGIKFSYNSNILITGTTDANKTIKYIYPYWFSSETSSIKNIQLEEGTVATEYEPYCGTTKTVYLNSPLYEGDELLTKDDKIYHYHKMGSVVLNGSESWAVGGYTLDNYIGFWFTPSIKGIVKKCDKFKVAIINEWNNLTLDDFICTDTATPSSNYNICIRIQKSKLSTTDVNGFEQWLSENPTTVIYELANPWYEPLGEYGKVILDGSEEIIQRDLSGANYRTYTIPFSNIKIKGKCYADKIKATDGFDTNVVNESLICCSSENSQLAISSNITTLNNFKQWLQQNPVTVIYELENPQSIDEDMIFDIATSSTLSYESAVPMGTTSFLPYTNELPLLETSTQYRVSFDCDVVGLPLVISLGGTTTTITSELHNTLSIITPSIETNGKLTIDGSGIANIDNVVVTKGEMVYEYFEGLKSSFEDRHIVNLWDGTFKKDWAITSAGIMSDVGVNGGLNTDCYMTNWIPCKPNTTYSVQGGDRNRWLVRNAKGEETFFGGYIGDETPTITTPNDAVELCCYYKLNSNALDVNTVHQNLAIWESNEITYEEVMIYKDGKYKAKIKLIKSPIEFGKGGRL